LTGDDPERQADWEAETALTELLTGLPDVEISNNFTARTVQAAERKRTSDPAGTKGGAVGGNCAGGSYRE